MAETEILFSYLILVGFITVIFTLTGQTVFGADFPENPFVATSFQYVSTCSTGDYLCFAGEIFGQGIALLTIPFTYLSYIFQMFMFFMTSSSLWWLGLVLFFPAGVVFLYLLIPIVIDMLKVLGQILHAIAEVIPF